MQLKTFFMLILAASLAACAGRTTVNGSWEQGVTKNQKFSDVLVITLARDSSRRQQFEDEMINNLSGTRTRATAGTDLIDPSTKITREMVEGLVTEHRFDAVIVSSVKEQVVVPKEITSKTDAKNYRSTGQSYGTFGEADRTFNFVQYDYKDEIDTKDYVVAKYTLILTTEVYETSDGKMVYTATSTAENQTDPSKMINSLAKKTSRQLRRSQVVNQ